MVIKDNLHQLIVDDEGSLFNEDSGNNLMVKTFSELYRVFRKSSNRAAADSKFQILYKNETSKWTSDTLNLNDLSEL